MNRISSQGATGRDSLEITSHSHLRELGIKTWAPGLVSDSCVQNFPSQPLQKHVRAYLKSGDTSNCVRFQCTSSQYGVIFVPQKSLTWEILKRKGNPGLWTLRPGKLQRKERQPRPQQVSSQKHQLYKVQSSLWKKLEETNVNLCGDEQAGL